MKPLYLLTLLCLSLLSNAQKLAPVVEWQKVLGGSNDDVAASIIPTSDHGLLLVGYSFSNDGQVSGHHGTVATSDGWVVKVDQDGNILWQNSYGGSDNDYFRHVVEAGNGDIICVGTTRSNDGDISGLHLDGTTPTEDLWVMRISKTGTVLWSKVFGGSQADHGQVIRTALDGGYIISGDASSNDFDVSGNHGFSDIWVIKIDESGNLQWQRAYGDPNSQFTTSMVVTSDSSYVISGYHTYKGYPATPLPVYARYDEVSLKIDVDGNPIWERYQEFTMGNPGQSYFFSKILETPGHQLVSIGHGLQETLFDRPNPVYKRINIQTGAPIGHLVGAPYQFYENIPVTELGPDAAIMLSDSSLLTGVASESINTYDAGLARIRSNDFKVVYNKNFNGDGLHYFSGVVALPNESYFAAGAADANNPFDDLPNTQGKDVWLVKFSELNRIKGKVYIDQNNNGMKDASEPYANNVFVESKKGSSTIAGAAFSQGDFINFVDTGTYTSTVKIPLPYYTINPASKQSVFTTYKNVDSFDFALVPIAGKNDLRISLRPVGRLRPGFPASYALSYSNTGTESIASVVIKMVKPSVTAFNSASVAPSSVDADTISWNIGTLAPLDESAITLELQVDPPPIVEIDTTLIISAIIEPVAGDETPENNVDTIIDDVRGSFDPNDKLENRGGVIIPDAASLAKPLTYTIRFQNTGTDTAFNVMIRDTLDAKLDWATLEIIGASHPNTLQIRNGNELTWTFKDILLPDSNVNEPASHGYIIYRIKPVSILQVGDTISNSASIYFDFNLPVKTNTHITLVLPDPPPSPVITGIDDTYCGAAGEQTGKITNLPASGSGISVTVKIDDNVIAVGADSTFSFSVDTLADGPHTLQVIYSNAAANRVNSTEFTVTAAETPDVDVSANITTITNLATPVIITATNKEGGGSAPLYTFARDRNFTNITQAESNNNTWTFDPSILAIGDNRIYVRMKSNATCIVANTVTDSILLVRTAATGITDPDMPGQVINIYPNPFKDVITVTGLSTAKKYMVSLYNLEGKQLVSKRVSGRTSIALARQHQASGIYWLSIYDENRKQLLGTVKMMKQ